jgi:hypothetical protein
MLVKRLILLFSIVFSTLIGKSQQINNGIVVSMDGYMIDFAGKKIFQPCEDTTINIWSALDNRSFGIWCNQITDVFCESIQGLGDTLIVDFKIPPESKVYRGSMSYFYCTIKIYMCFLSGNDNDFKRYDGPEIKLLHNNKECPLLGFYIREKLLEIAPHDTFLFMKMCEFYRKNKYDLPEWIQNYKRI